MSNPINHILPGMHQLVSQGTADDTSLIAPWATHAWPSPAEGQSYWYDILNQSKIYFLWLWHIMALHHQLTNSQMQILWYSLILASLLWDVFCYHGETIPHGPTWCWSMRSHELKQSHFSFCTYAGSPAHMISANLSAAFQMHVQR